MGVDLGVSVVRARLKRHGDADFPFFVVPVYGEPDVSFAFPVTGDCVVLFEKRSLGGRSVACPHI